MKRLCITPCGVKKIWDKHPEAGVARAEEAYIGAFANACQTYARTFFEEWVILSAKNGVLFPDDVLTENYDVSFTSDPALVISVERLREQWLAREFADVEEVVVLGGKKYARREAVVLRMAPATAHRVAPAGVSRHRVHVASVTRRGAKQARIGT